MGNMGWKTMGQKLEAEYDFNFFEECFCRWQKEAILLTEITYAEDYTYVTPIGVFTHIGTLARALQYEIDKDWDVHVTMIGDELRIAEDKHIAGARHELICKCVELDQTNSEMHHDGWKFEKNVDFSGLLQEENR